MDALTPEQLKVKILQKSNFAEVAEGGAYLERKKRFFSSNKKAFTIKEETVFEYMLGSSASIIDFITNMKNANKPWKIIEKIKDKEVIK